MLALLKCFFLFKYCIQNSRNLYWIELDIQSAKPKGRLLTSLLDGRYRKTLFSVHLERPTSLVLDPELG